ncbi:MAG: DegT/DnrJ/EryC1/StrS family aminotransferase [Deltaproteobacteria bacterium]|nr:DegT/DnrJ/EryC1/StrS family aminotransferase [Deltaproteobacteria bacterium]MBW2052292.1 DegT/DnrJ/EryC1/StrS family aminotransferase [Deltaproteobacteria bacterium]MBW2140613.1 DegT/DnrJ/EryC1/StrS family aminotransferase [Deltaproteobacteria bacterium]
MSIAFIDLKKQFNVLEKDIRSAVDRVFEHAQFIMGPEVIQLEQELAKFAGVKHAIGCSSGTDALLLPLLAYEVGPGDAIFTTPFTFIATAEVISLLGATPVFVDIDAKTYNIDPELLKEAVERVSGEGRLRPRGIIPVDLFGLPADYDPIMTVAQDHDLFVLEDAAQGFGGAYFGRPAGSLSHAASTSFFPAKPLGCYGDGGAIFTNDDSLTEKMRSLLVHGQGINKYDNVRVGINGRLDTIQAAILLVKLAAFPDELKERQRVADRYTEGLRNHLETPIIPEGHTSSWAQYSVQSDHREALQNSLKESGIPTAIYYPKPLHLQDAFVNLGHQTGDFPISEAASRRIFSLPMHPYLTNEQIDSITNLILKNLRNKE